MMTVKGLIDEDFVQYKKPSMFIGFPTCSWKCEKECGQRVCQNSTLAKSPDIHIDIIDMIDRYIKNPITEAVVIGGLEPIDSFDQLESFIKEFRGHSNDDVVIYTGFYPYEIQNQIAILKQYKNIIIKFGRYIPGQERHYDEVLGVYLASDNQYAEKVS